MYFGPPEHARLARAPGPPAVVVAVLDVQDCDLQLRHPGMRPGRVRGASQDGDREALAAVREGEIWSGAGWLIVVSGGDPAGVWVNFDQGRRRVVEPMQPRETLRVA